jgi:hypothetical protein
MNISDEHPAPWPQHEAKVRPSATQLRTEARKAAERAHGALEPLSGVLGQAVSPDQALEVVGSRPGDLNPRQGLQVVQRYRPSSFGILEALMGPLQRPRQAIQEVSYVAWVGVSFVERLRKKGSRERAFIDVRSLGHFGELGRVVRVEGDIETPRRFAHSIKPTRLSTRRVWASLSALGVRANRLSGGACTFLGI